LGGAEYRWALENVRHNPAVRTVARLLAERDAMQALIVEGIRQMEGITDRSGEDWTDFNRGYRAALIDLKIAWRKASAEPTPDPDLVLAREAAEEVRKEYGLAANGPYWRAFEQSALRALKLAKEQAHDQ
jgi:hypothetical protein